MINNIFLINSNYLKSVTVLSDNVDDRYIGTAIMKAQLQGLLPLIGEKLYDKLCTLVSVQNDIDNGNNQTNNDPNGGINDPKNKEYRTLLDVYVSAYLVQKSMADIQFNLWAKMRNEGVINYADTNTNQVGVADIKYIVNCYNLDATFFGKRLVDYLIANNKLFPEFTQCEKGKVKPNVNKTDFCKITL